MKQDDGFQSLGNLFTKLQATQTPKVKPPAHEWQDLALKIISEFNVPNFKRSSMFKVCKENSKEAIERALNDTRELCQSGNKWSYFFKVIDSYQFPNKVDEAKKLQNSKNYIAKLNSQSRKAPRNVAFEE
jgi:hypothetical protein